MAEDSKLSAQREIHKSLSLCNLCTRGLGISFIDASPITIFEKFKMYLVAFFSTTMLFSLVFGEIVFVVKQLIGTTSIAQFIFRFHIAGYGSMSVCKCITIWTKRHVFRQLISELEEIWPVTVDDEVSATIKRKSINVLRLRQLGYMFWNVLGLVLYSATPLILHFYRRSQGLPSEIGFIWYVWYPFDKFKPIYHECVYCFEMFAGTFSVFAMLGSDMLFMTMTSHISMLLRLLQVKIRNLVPTDTVTGVNQYSKDFCDCYDEIVSVIKIHQRLIRYSNDLEDSFSLVNLIIVLLSSVNICCVVFNIVFLETWMEMSNKFFLGAALTQVGILCWYADDIYRASIGLADAVYESGWYESNTRCRRALLLLLQRSQKPLYFTAFKFRNITMLTYNSILTTSYSYFTLLYTVYSD